MMKDYKKVLEKIRKYFKHTEQVLEIYLENYHNNYIYIRVDYYKKLKKHKLSWIDLRHYNNNFESIVSYEYMPDDMSNYLRGLLSDLDNKKYYNKKIKEKYKVHVLSDLVNKDEKYQLIFNQFINKEDKTLYSIFNVVFENLPNKLFCFFEELEAIFKGNTGKYECEEEFEFDLFKGDMTEIFEESVRERGLEFYQSGRVLFLEKIKNEYVAIVGDTSLISVSVKYDEDTKQVQMVCACPQDCCCHHFYAVILAIRNKKFNKFYKVTLKRNGESLLDRVMNFNYILSIGMDDQGVHFLIIEDNKLKLVPVVDQNGECIFEVLEDDDEENLTKRIQEVTSKIK